MEHLGRRPVLGDANRDLGRPARGAGRMIGGHDKLRTIDRADARLVAVPAL